MIEDAPSSAIRGTGPHLIRDTTRGHHAVTDVIAADETFDPREPGWIEAILEPAR
jgi:hypothetical protein